MTQTIYSLSAIADILKIPSTEAREKIDAAGIKPLFVGNGGRGVIRHYGGDAVVFAKAARKEMEVQMQERAAAKALKAATKARESGGPRALQGAFTLIDALTAKVEALTAQVGNIQRHMAVGRIDTLDFPAQGEHTLVIGTGVPVAGLPLVHALSEAVHGGRDD